MTVSGPISQGIDGQQRYELVVRRIAEQEQRLDRLLDAALAGVPHTVSLPWHVQELRRSVQEHP